MKSTTTTTSHSQDGKQAIKLVRRARRRDIALSKPNEQLLQEAYEKLNALDSLTVPGLDPETVSRLPQITPIINRLPRGVKGAIEFLRGSEDNDARKWLAVYDAVPVSVRNILPFEAFCQASGISTKRMLEVVMGAVFEQSEYATKLIAAANEPDIVQATVRAAKKYDGSQDRKMLHLATKFLPSPKNQTTNFFGSASQHNLQDNSQNLTISAGAVPQIEDKMARVADRFNERLGLTSGAVPILTDDSEDNATMIEDGDED